MDFGRIDPFLRFVLEEFLEVVVEGLVVGDFLDHLVVELEILD